MNRRLKFCRTCNCRERVIEYGKCIICGHDPDEYPVNDYLIPPRKMFSDIHRGRGEWTALDWYALGVCVVMTVYILVHIVVWRLR